jgi:competence protein ComFC
LIQNRAKFSVKQLINKVEYLIFPGEGICVICKSPLKDLEEGICSDCISQIPTITKPYCTKCGKPLSGNIRYEICNDCLLMSKRYFLYNRSYGEYNDVLRETIISYKYKNKKSLAYPLGTLMLKTYNEQDWRLPQYIIPVPLSMKRMRHRGFNQAKLLSNVISQNTGIPVLERILMRTRATEHQTKLGKNERQENVKGAFKLIGDANIKGNTLLLIDDVYTTGATLNECSKVLIEAGASRIYSLTLAIGRDL